MEASGGTEAITFVLTLRIKETADIEDVIKTASLMMASTEKKPGALFYQYYMKNSKKLKYFETFSNSVTARSHLLNQDPQLHKEWFNLIELASCRVIGPADTDLKEVLKNIPVPCYYFDRLGGFGPREEIPSK